jgi:signal transduction histidine kinase
MRAFCEILRDNPGLGSGQLDHFLAIVIRESERLTRPINRVRDLSKPKSNGASWQYNRFDLGDPVREAGDAMSPVFRDSCLQLTPNLPGSAPEVVANRDRAIKVMMNLLSNTTKFCDADQGTLSVSLEQVAATLAVSVTDNGVGNSLENHSVIFDKFRRVGDTLTSEPNASASQRR